MTEFFDLLISFIKGIYLQIDSFSFDVYGFNVSLAEVFLGFIILNMFVLLFWKGAKG